MIVSALPRQQRRDPDQEDTYAEGQAAGVALKFAAGDAVTNRTATRRPVWLRRPPPGAAASARTSRSDSAAAPYTPPAEGVRSLTRFERDSLEH